MNTPLKNIKVHLEIYQLLLELKHGNDTFDTVIQRLFNTKKKLEDELNYLKELANEKAEKLNEEDKLLTYGKQENAPFKVVRNTEYRSEDRNLGRGEDRGRKGSEKVLMR